MLHITKHNSNNHKKVLASEVLVILAMMLVFSSSASDASDITSDMVIELANKARIGANVATLKKNDLLQKAAEKKAQDIIEKNYFSHVSPNGTSPWDLIDEVGYDYRFAGENLAINFTNAEEQQEAWMTSPTHKRNILNSNYQEIGVAVRRGEVDGRETLVTVQEFGSVMPQVISDSGISDGIGVGASVAGTEKISKKVDFNSLYNDHAPTLVGWFIAFAIALIIFVIDAAALIHRRHAQVLLFHEQRSKYR